MSLTAIVTGAASGIGLASAKLLLKDAHQPMAFDPQKVRMHNELQEHEEIAIFGGDVFKSGLVPG